MPFMKKIFKTHTLLIGLLLLIYACSSSTSKYRSISSYEVVSSEELTQIYESDTYRRLIRDLYFELDHYDGINADQESTGIFLNALEKYISSGSYSDLINNIPDEWKGLFDYKEVIQEHDSTSAKK